MGKDYGKTDSHPFSSTFVRLPGGKELWQTSYED